MMQIVRNWSIFALSCNLLYYFCDE